MTLTNRSTWLVAIVAPALMFIAQLSAIAWWASSIQNKLESAVQQLSAIDVIGTRGFALIKMRVDKLEFQADSIAKEIRISQERVDRLDTPLSKIVGQIEDRQRIMGERILQIDGRLNELANRRCR